MASRTLVFLRRAFQQRDRWPASSRGAQPSLLERPRLVAITLLAGVVSGGNVFAAESAAAHAEHCIVGQSVFGCRSERDLEQIIAYHDDVAALREALAMNIASGNCSPFGDGERVIFLQRSGGSDLTAVRRPDESDAFWIAGSWSRPASDCGDSASRSIYAKLGLPEPTESRPARPAGTAAAELAAALPGKPLACVYKPVMTDAEISRCRIRQH